MAQTKVKLISDGVIVQSNLHASHGITTAHIGEGSNLYYTDARVGSYLSSNGYATQSTIVAAITDSAPSTLDTLNELAAALGDDVNFSTTVTNSIALKAPLASPSFTGNATFVGNITTLADKRISVGTWDNSAFTGGNAYGFSITSSMPLLHLTESDQTNKKAYVGLSGGNMYVGGLISNLYLQTGTSGTIALSIDSSQNATFAGAVTIDSNLTINGPSTKFNTDGDSFFEILDAGTNACYLRAGASDEIYIGANNNYQLRLKTNKDVVMDNGGNLGIGVGSPVGKLQVSLPTYTNEDTNSQQAIFGVDSGYGVRIGYNETDNKGYINVLKPGVAWGSLILQEDIGKVGIGTTSPEQKLHVEGRGIFDGGASSDILQIRNDNGSGVFGMTSNLFALDLASTSNFRIRQGSSVPLYLKSDGNLGIGTTSPTTALSVSDGATMYGNSNYLVQIKRNATNGDDNTSKASILLGNNSNGMQIAYGGTTDRLRFIDGGGVERITMLNGGGVGIGVTDPEDRLQIDHPGNPTAIRIGDNTTDDCYVIFNTDGNDWSIGTDRSDSNKFKISDYSRVGTNDRLVIDTSGNVGIGTASLSQKLDVAGNIRIRGTNQGILLDTTGADQAARVLVENDYELAVFTNRGSAGFGVFGNSNIRFGFGTSHTAGQTSLFINSSGDVGIGTPSPSSTLSVQGTTNNGINVIGVGTTANRCYVGLNSSNHGQLFVTGSSGQNPSLISSAGANSYISGGKFGIGNTNPTWALNTNLSIEGTSLAYLDGTSNNQTTTNNIGVSHNASGFGGTNGVQGGLFLANNNNANNAPSPIIFFGARSASNTYNHAYAAIYGIKTGGGADSNWNVGELTFATGDGTGPRRRMTIDKDGYVGINQTDPGYTLDVRQGRIALTGLSAGTGGHYIALSGQLPGYATNLYNCLETNLNDMHFAAGGTYTGYISHNGGFTDVSDASLKENIEDIPDALNKVINLRGRYFTWKNELQSNDKQVGFIAQEVEEYLPEVVTSGAGGTKGIAYGKMTALLVNAIKELKAEIETLKTQINN